MKKVCTSCDGVLTATTQEKLDRMFEVHIKSCPTRGITPSKETKK